MLFMFFNDLKTFKVTKIRNCVCRLVSSRPAFADQRLPVPHFWNLEKQALACHNVLYHVLKTLLLKLWELKITRMDLCSVQKVVTSTVSTVNVCRTCVWISSNGCLSVLLGGATGETCRNFLFLSKQRTFVIARVGWNVSGLVDGVVDLETSGPSVWVRIMSTAAFYERFYSIIILSPCMCIYAECCRLRFLKAARLGWVCLWVCHRQ